MGHRRRRVASGARGGAAWRRLSSDSITSDALLDDDDLEQLKGKQTSSLQGGYKCPRSDNGIGAESWGAPVPQIPRAGGLPPPTSPAFAGGFGGRQSHTPTGAGAPPGNDLFFVAKSLVRKQTSTLNHHFVFL